MPATAISQSFQTLKWLVLRGRRSNEPLYHRHARREEAELVARTGELWGSAPRNFYASSIPCVKAYAGGLDPGDRGYEFTTPVRPTRSSVYERRWVEGSPGVRVEDGIAKIPVRVTRIRTGKP